MIGVIDVGGGNRGAFGAGVFDRCLDKDINFDYCVGVSAGAANCASYIAKQRGRNYKFYTDYNLSVKAINPVKVLFHRSVIDLDYIYGTLSNTGGLSPLDYEAMVSSHQRFIIVSAEAETGKAKYFEKEDLSKNEYGAICASCCMPILNKPYIVNGVPYYDGGIADPIPIEKALNDGCDRIVVILTLPKDFFRSGKNDSLFTYRLRKYPKSRDAVINRAEVYNRELQRVLDLEEEGKVLIVAPKKKANIRTLGKDITEIFNLYREGYSAANAIIDFIR